MNKFKNKLNIWLLWSPAVPIAIIGSLGAMAYAAADLPGLAVNNISQFQEQVMCQIAAYMFDILISLSVVFVIWAAYNYLLSRGEEERIRTATRTITYAAVSIVVALLAKAFPLLVSSIVGGGAYAGCGTATAGSGINV